jgi:hypothetical protein
LGFIPKRQINKNKAAFLNGIVSYEWIEESFKSLDIGFG